MSTAQAQAAHFEWQEGARRLAEVPAVSRAGCEAVVTAVQQELRRRLGSSFTVAELAVEYAVAHRWFLAVALDTAPKVREAHDGSVTLDGAFARFMRRAQDASLW